MEKIPVIMDVDTGVDDAQAITLLLSSDQVDVKGFTTTFGNADLDTTTRNTLRVLKMLGREDIPVARGAAVGWGPNGGEPDEDIDIPIHGYDGLGDVTIPESDVKPVDITATAFMAKTVRESDKPVTIIAVGPMTNTATFFATHPDLKNKVEKLVIMGGGIYGGNVTHDAEANIWCDPDAARAVFQSGVPVYMAGLDITMKAYAQKEERDAWRATGHVGDTIADMYLKYAEVYEKYFHTGKCALHDSVAVAWVIHPEWIGSKPAQVDIVLEGKPRGRTVADYELGGKAPNAYVGLDINREAFLERLLQSLRHFS